jgi:transcriptional regulator with XRE-family HTH domain
MEFAKCDMRSHDALEMTGEEMKSIRVSAGLSQAELAAAIGMTRESIGRMERSGEAVERRTELAIRYIAEFGARPERTLAQTHESVARLLDDASVRASPSIERTEKLKQALDDWTAAAGSDEGRQLLYRAQGVIGMINVTDRDDPLWSRTMSDLTQLKLEWAAARP